jgi:hypothetical protein
VKRHGIALGGRIQGRPPRRARRETESARLEEGLEVGRVLEVGEAEGAVRRRQGRRDFQVVEEDDPIVDHPVAKSSTRLMPRA